LRGPEQDLRLFLQPMDVRDTNIMTIKSPPAMPDRTSRALTGSSIFTPAAPPVPAECGFSAATRAFSFSAFSSTSSPLTMTACARYCSGILCISSAKVVTPFVFTYL